MLGSNDGLTVTDIARSMKRIGFSQQEIYDTFTGAGVSGSEIQLLLDRIEIDFEDAKLESRASRLAKEVEKIFNDKLKEIKVDLESELRVLNHSLKSATSALERVESRITELQKVCCSIPQKAEE